MEQPTGGKKVLVVDDEVFVRMLVADVLDEAGFNVIEAGDAQTALKCLETARNIEVLFTDINMPPGINGLELAAQVHQLWPHIGLVVTSGYERPSDGEIADGGLFVPKPFRSEEIVRAVEVATGHRHA
jgi:CheY-like chemotaxis protein